MAPYIRSVAKAGNCSPLEGDGFELPVPRCARPADSAVLAVSPDSVVSSSSWNGPLHSIGCQGRQLLATAAPTVDRPYLGRSPKTVAYLARN
jgi:hypothetical protein